MAHLPERFEVSSHMGHGICDEELVPTWLRVPTVRNNHFIPFHHAHAFEFMLMNRLRIVTICLKVQEVFSISQVPFGRKDTRRTSQYCLAIYFRKFSSGDVMDQEQVAKLERRAKVAEESIDALRGRLNTLKGIYGKIFWSRSVLS